MTSSFRIIEHTLPGQHIREYPHGTKHREEDVFQIAIKQYIPAQNPDPLPEKAITIIALHANGFPKEIYEPLFHEVYVRLQKVGMAIRGIWIADSSNQGASGVLNEHIQGDSVGHFDHSRDLLIMVNHFRDQMPRPLIGFAHSYGGTQLVHLSYIHPRLFSTLILCEPVILSDYFDGIHPALPSTLRPDLWKSRQEAEAGLKKVFKRWDPRVLDLYLEHGLRSLPTAVYPQKNENAVTLTTTKHQEAWTFTTMNLDSRDEAKDRILRPDQNEFELTHMSARPELMSTFRELQYVRPSVFFVFGKRSYLSPPKEIDARVKITGTGVGGNGGAARGKVEQLTIEKGGHLIPFEQINELADGCADWLKRWFDQWNLDENLVRGWKNKKSDAEMLRVSKEWVKGVKMPVESLRPLKEKL